MPDETLTAPSLAPCDRDFACDALRLMSGIRAFEAKALSLTQSDPPRVMGSMHFCAGQEAVPVGAAAALRADDQIVATYRGHGWALAAGLEARAAMAEICHRRSGVNGGRAGSAYLMPAGSRFVGETSIVGAGASIACGLALANLAGGDGRVVAVSIGDGALNQGAVHEALAFAAARRLPVLFVCENNGWSELTPTGDMFAVDRLAKRGYGYGIAAATIDGADPLAVRDSVTMAAERCRGGEGPVLLECLAPRLWGHYHLDIEHYRPRADREAAQARDPLRLLADRLMESGAMTRAEIEALIQAQEEAVESMTEAVLLEPQPDPAEAALHVVAPLRPDSAVAAEEAAGAAPAREMTYVEAVNAALRNILERDERAIVYGEDVAAPGGVFGATRCLQRDFGPERVFDTPIAENAILGSALGAALGGLRPVVEIMWADFLFVALDQLVNQASNVRYLTRGEAGAPLVVRTQQGATPGSCAQHSQSVEAILAHVPGLKVALAATPQDAYTLLRAAAADPDPCVVIEHRGLYRTRGPVVTGGPVETPGIARLHRSGGDAALVTWGSMLPTVLEAAAALEEIGVEVSVLDLRWLAPLDEAALARVVADSGGSVLVVHEAVRSGGFAGEIALRIEELCGGVLARPVRRLTTPDVRMPAAPALQAALIPNAGRIVAAVQALLGAIARPATAAGDHAGAGRG